MSTVHHWQEVAWTLSVHVLLSSNFWIIIIRLLYVFVLFPSFEMEVQSLHNSTKPKWAVKETVWLGNCLKPMCVKPWAKIVDAVLKMKPPPTQQSLGTFWEWLRVNVSHNQRTRKPRSSPFSRSQPAKTQRRQQSPFQSHIHGRGILLESENQFELRIQVLFKFPIFCFEYSYGNFQQAN